MGVSNAHVENIAYKGRTVEANVPDTLDLAERAALALSSLTQIVVPDYGYTAYHRCRLFTDPPIMYLPDYAAGCEPKFVEAFPMLRVMSGSDFNADLDAGMMEALTNDIEADDILYSKHLVYPQREKPWPRLGPYFYATVGTDFCSPLGQGRMMLAMMVWRQLDGNPMWDDYLRRMAKGLGDMAVSVDDYAYYADGMIGAAYSYPRGGWKATREPTREVSGEEGSMFDGYRAQIRALAKWYGVSGDENALEIATRLVRFVLKPRFWEDVEHAWFGKTSHLHAHVAMLWALLEVGQVTGDEHLKDFARFGYERARDLGIPRIGCFAWTTEACASSDMVALAVKLSQYGVGDYWDDVEAYIRNQMIEHQLTDRDLIQQEVVGRGPKWEPDPPQVISDRVLDRAIGSFARTPCPTRVYTAWTVCCPVNGSEALYYAWEGILEHRNGNVQVNMLLNRVSPWLDVSSYLPYEGKVVLTNKSANKVMLRVPRWVADADLKLSVNGGEVGGQRFGRYVLVDRLKPRDTVTMEFPVVQETQSYRIEGSIDLSRWESKEYTCTFKGNTLIDIDPRDETLERDHGYMADPTTHGSIPIYLRDHLKADKAPMKRVSRFVSDNTPIW